MTENDREYLKFEKHINEYWESRWAALVENGVYDESIRERLLEVRRRCRALWIFSNRPAPNFGFADYVQLELFE